MITHISIVHNISRKNKENIEQNIGLYFLYRHIIVMKGGCEKSWLKIILERMISACLCYAGLLQ